MTARRLRAAAASVVVAVLLAACAQPDLDAGRARTLQRDVLAVSEAAAEGRLDAAAVLLEQVRRGVEDAHGAGEVSDARYADVTAALDAVDARLEADLAAQAAAAQAEAAAAQDAVVAAAVAAAAQEAAAQEAAAQQAAREEAAREGTTVPPAGTGTVRTAPAVQDKVPPGQKDKPVPPGRDRGKGPGKDG